MRPSFLPCFKIVRALSCSHLQMPSSRGRRPELETQWHTSRLGFSILLGSPGTYSGVYKQQFVLVDFLFLKGLVNGSYTFSAPWIDYSTIPCMVFGTGPKSNFFTPKISVRLRLRVAVEVEFQVASVMSINASCFGRSTVAANHATVATRHVLITAQISTAPDRFRDPPI